MTLFVDTSVWSLAMRRDDRSDAPQVRALQAALEGSALVVTTGIVLQELLQGFAGPRAREDIVDRFSALPLLVPDRHDHIEAASLRNACRRASVDRPGATEELRWPIASVRATPTRRHHSSLTSR